MRVGISTASFFNKCDLEDAPLRLARLGADVCEVFFNTFSEYRTEFVDLLHERILEAGIEVHSVHPMGTQFEPQLFSLYHRQREDAEEIFINVLKAGKKLGAKYYVMHGPAGLNGAVKNMEIERVGAATRRLCEIAADYGQEIAWENVSWCLFSTPEYAYGLSQAADAIRFTLDIKQAVRSGHSPLDYIEAMGERLINLHVCDYAEVDGRMRPQLPGRGECSFSELHAALERIDYVGPGIMELYSDLYDNDDELMSAFNYVKQGLG